MFIFNNSERVEFTKKKSPQKSPSSAKRIKHWYTSVFMI